MGLGFVLLIWTIIGTFFAAGSGRSTVNDVKFLSPDDFYRRWRFGALDLTAAAGMIFPPGIGFITLVLMFWRSLRSS